MSAQMLEAPPRSHATTEMYQQRMDGECHAAVDHGIAVQASSNTICAVEYMKAHNVDPAVIERVLLHPELRRKSPH